MRAPKKQKFTKEEKAMFFVTAGLAVGTIGLCIVAAIYSKKCPDITETTEMIKPLIPTKVTEKVSTFGGYKQPFNVSGHPRNLSGNRRPSQQALELAKQAGIKLLDNQTYVKDYVKGGEAA